MEIPGYDTWRLSGPPEVPAPVVETVEYGVTIDLPEGYLETPGTFNAETGALVAVVIAGRTVPAAAIEAFVGPVEWARIECLRPDVLSDLCADAARDAEEARGDYLYEMWRDQE